MLVFYGYLGPYAQRKLVADHINYKKDVYWSHWMRFQQIRWKKLGRIGWNSRIICILKHYWCLNWALVWWLRFLNKAFTNSIFNWEENKCFLPLMITDFHFYYNNKCKHSKNKMTPREVLFNYN